MIVLVHQQSHRRLQRCHVLLEVVQLVVVASSTLEMHRVGHLDGLVPERAAHRHVHGPIWRVDARFKKFLQIRRVYLTIVTSVLGFHVKLASFGRHGLPFVILLVFPAILDIVDSLLTILEYSHVLVVV